MHTAPINYQTLAARFTGGEDSPISFRPIMVWAINDRIDPATARQQFDGFKRCGYGGVMIMPWGAMPYEFMDDDWLDAVELATNHAASIGLNVWLWDDWLFGSGSACGHVTQNPNHRAKTLRKPIDLIIEPGESTTLTVPPRTIAIASFAADKFGNPTSDFHNHDATPGATIDLSPTTRTRITAICAQSISGMVHTHRSHGYFLDPAVSEKDCAIYTTDDPDVWSVDMLNPRATAQYLTLIHDRYHQRLGSHFGKTIKGFFYDEPKTPTTQPWTEDFAQRFKAIKGYDLADHLVEAMTDHVRDGGNHNPWSKSERGMQSLADYRDVWTSLMAESFYKPVHDWCRAHGVSCTGHQISDNSFSEMFGGGGIIFKNLRFSDMPGIDTISGGVKPGVFNDFARFPASIAAANNATRTMSESFAVYGHGVTLDEMRYVCEHQITRGINTFFFKLTNYNRPRSIHFHPPELSDENPIIRDYGNVLAKRVEHLTDLLTAGSPARKVAVYVPLGNYYRDDRSFINAIEALTRKLTYNQIDYDYVCDADVEAMSCDDDGVVTANGHTYEALLLTPGAIPPADAQRLNVLALQGHSLDTFIEGFHQQDPRMSITSRDVSVAMRRRTASDSTEACFMLSESAEPTTLAFTLRAEARILEVDIDTQSVTCIAQGGEGTPLSLAFAPGQSRLLLIEPANPSTPPCAKPTPSQNQITITDWTLTLPDGKAHKVSPPYPDWASFGYGGYTGEATYSATFTLKDEATCRLSLGEVRHAATVSVDDKVIADAVFTPFIVDLGHLKSGEHRIMIRVLNTMANTFFGDPAKTEALREAGAFKGTYAPIYEPIDRRKLRSGLFGPVLLQY